jgi:hypothetical protein
MCREGLFGKCIEFSGACIVLNGRVEPIGVKYLEPGTQTGQFPRFQLLDGFFDVFGSRHAGDIAPVRRREKGARECG